MESESVEASQKVHGNKGKPKSAEWKAKMRAYWDSKKAIVQQEESKEVKENESVRE